MRIEEGMDAVVVLNEHDALILYPIGLLCVPWTHMHAYMEFLIKGRGRRGVELIFQEQNNIYFSYFCNDSHAVSVFQNYR